MTDESLATDRDIQMLEQRISATEKLLDEKLRSRDHAVAIATAAMDKRLDGMNEFRETLKDQAQGFVAKTSYDILVDRTNKLENRLANFDGKVWMLGAIAVVVSTAISWAISVHNVPSLGYQAPPTVVSPAVIPIAPTK